MLQFFFRIDYSTLAKGSSGIYRQKPFTLFAPDGGMAVNWIEESNFKSLAPAGQACRGDLDGLESYNSGKLQVLIVVIVRALQVLAIFDHRAHDATS